MEITVKVQVTPKNRTQIMKALELICDEKLVWMPGEKAEPIKKEPIKEKPAPAKAEPASNLTATDVRAVALKFTNAGRGRELKEIMGKYGAVKLSAIAEDRLGDVLNDLNAALGEVK